MEHLTAGQLAGYLDEGLADEDRRKVERHLDACPECRDELADLTRLVANVTPPRGTRLPARSLWRWGVPLAVAAAAAALALFRTDVPGPVPTAVERPAVGTADATSSVDAIAPIDGAAVVRGELIFTWRAKGTEVYRLTLLDEAGELVWTADVADTTAVPPDSVVLAPGTSYFWRVEAIADGIAASSGVRRLEIAP